MDDFIKKVPMFTICRCNAFLMCQRPPFPLAYDKNVNDYEDM